MSFSSRRASDSDHGLTLARGAGAAAFLLFIVLYKLGDAFAGALMTPFLLKAMEVEKADGMIVLMAKFCEPHMYYYPEVKEAFERHGVPHLLIETEHEAVALESLKTRVETFLEIVKRRLEVTA